MQLIELHLIKLEEKETDFIHALEQFINSCFKNVKTYLRIKKKIKKTTKIIYFR